MNTSRTAVTRRALFAAGAGASAAALAACSTNGGTDSSAIGSGSGDNPTVTPDADGSIDLASIPVGGGISASVKGAPVVVEQPKAGEVVAFSAICTHQGCVVAPAGNRFDCPCHGSQYDGATGKVLHGPATRPLAKRAVTVDGGRVTFS